MQIPPVGAVDTALLQPYGRNHGERDILDTSNARSVDALLPESKSTSDGRDQQERKHRRQQTTLRGKKKGNSNGNGDNSDGNEGGKNRSGFRAGPPRKMRSIRNLFGGQNDRGRDRDRDQQQMIPYDESNRLLGKDQSGGWEEVSQDGGRERQDIHSARG